MVIRSLLLITCLLSAGLCADDAADQQLAERYLTALRRRPAFGTALDRLISLYSGQGNIDAVIDDLASPTADSVDRLLAGMILLKKSEAKRAVELLLKVEAERADDPVASSALAKAHQRVGSLQDSIQAWRRAIDRAPRRQQLPEMYRSLAQLYQRTGKPQQALTVWSELESLFPLDRRIREDVATRLQQDGQLDAALERWTMLAADAQRPEQIVTAGLAAADLQVRTGQSSGALVRLQNLLDRVEPGGWRDETIRQRIERLTHLSGGANGVLEWYRRRHKAVPESLPVSLRLGELLSAAGHNNEAALLYRQAIEQNPASLDARWAQVQHLAAQMQLTDATIAGRKMIALRAAGRRELEYVGRLILQNPNLAEPARRQQATDVWMQIAGDGTDAVALGDVARLHRQYGMTEQAIALYRRVIELVPEELSWREELGRCLFEQGRQEEALTVWREMAAGPRKSTSSLAHLSRVLESVQDSDGALQTMQNACTLTPELTDRLRLVNLLRRSGRLDECYLQLAEARSIAESLADRRRVHDMAQEVWKHDPLLLRRTEQLAQLDSKNTDVMLQLARMNHVAMKYSDAVHWADLAVAGSQSDIEALGTAAEVYQSAGLLERAAQMHREIADISPRHRTESLRKVIQIEQQLGHQTRALNAAAALATETPDHIPTCRQYAELCFAAGQETEGIQILRKCLRLNASDHQLAADVSEILAEQFQINDAREVLWSTFPRVSRNEQRYSILSSLIDISSRAGVASQVFDHLQSFAAMDPVDRVLCVAHVQRHQDKLKAARQTLQTAVDQFAGDVRLLTMLVEVAEVQEDFESAATYQEMIVQVTGGPNATERLASLQYQAGTLSEAELAWIRDARSGRDVAAAVRGIDHFLEGGRLEAAELMCERLAIERPRDWRVLYRLGMIQWKLQRQDTAAETLRRIVNLKLPVDHAYLEVSGKEHPIPHQQKTCLALRRVRQVAESLNWLQQYTGNELWSEHLTAPPDYGAACCAAFAFLWLNNNSDESVAALLADPSELPDIDRLTQRSAVLSMEYWSKAPAEFIDVAGLISNLQELKSPTASLLICEILSAAGRPLRKHQLLIDAARRVALARPDWLSDVGGWATIIPALDKDCRREVLPGVHSDLLESENTGSILSAARLACATHRLPDFLSSLRALLPAAKEDPQLLQRCETLLIGYAEDSHLIDRDHWEQLIDIALELDAPHYRKSSGTEVLPVTWQWTAGPRASPALARSQQVRQGPQATHVRTTPTIGIIQLDLSGLHIEAQFSQYVHPLLLRALLLTGTRNDPQFPHEDLVQHLDANRENLTSPHWLTATLSLAAADLALQETRNGIRRLVDVAAAIPTDHELRVCIAIYLASVGAFDDGLKILDALPQADQRDDIVTRELLALHLAVLAGSQQHAVQAAARLNEVALDPQQVSWITRQLKAAELPMAAERFHTRVTAAATGRTQHLRRAMNQYRTRGNMTAASRIARQFVLQPSITLDGATAVEATAARMEAISLLIDAGHVDPVIRTLQERVRIHDSMEHRSAVIELLRAAGRKSEADKAAEELRERLNADTTNTIGHVRHLERGGQLEAAAVLSHQLLQLNPNLFHRDYYRFIRLYEKTGRLKQLAEVLLQSPSGSEDSGHWGVQQLTERLLADEQTHSLGLALFRKAWNTWPGSRSALLANVGQDSIWTLSEVYRFHLQRLTRLENDARQPWDGIAEILRVDGYGLTSGRLSRQLIVPRQQHDFKELRTAITSVHERDPDWHAGQIYLAMADLYSGQTEAARVRLGHLTSASQSSIPVMSAWVLASELHRAEELPEVTRQLLRFISQTHENGRVLLKSDSAWHCSPDYLLAIHEARAGESEATVNTVRRLIDRIDRHRRSGRWTAYSVGAVSKLVEELMPLCPEAARELQKVDSTIAANPENRDARGPFDDRKTRAVIDAVRERLLPPHRVRGDN